MASTCAVPDVAFQRTVAVGAGAERASDVFRTFYERFAVRGEALGTAPQLHRTLAGRNMPARARLSSYTEHFDFGQRHAVARGPGEHVTTVEVSSNCPAE